MRSILDMLRGLVAWFHRWRAWKKGYIYYPTRRVLLHTRDGGAVIVKTNPFDSAPLRLRFLRKRLVAKETFVLEDEQYEGLSKEEYIEFKLSGEDVPRRHSSWNPTLTYDEV